jgi:hypothetical protein
MGAGENPIQGAMLRLSVFGCMLFNGVRMHGSPALFQVVLAGGARALKYQGAAGWLFSWREFRGCDT